jgi:acyl carrier protein
MPATITADSVEQKIREVLPEFGVDPDAIALDATFADLDVDSLDIAELSQIIEDEYCVRLADEDLVKLETIEDTIKLVLSFAS